MIEILSAGNKSSNHEFQAFLTKVWDALARGLHLLLVDLHPRTSRDPDGIYTEIWAEVSGEPSPARADKPLTLAAFDAGPPVISYVEPIAVGDVLIDMPLFLRLAGTSRCRSKPPTRPPIAPYRATSVKSLIRGSDRIPFRRRR